MLWDLESGRKEHTLLPAPHGGAGVLPLTAVFAPEGDALALVVGRFYHGGVELFGVAAGRSLRILEEIRGDMGATNGVAAVAFSPDGKTIAANDWAATPDGPRAQVGLWSRRDGTWLATVFTGAGKSPEDLWPAFSPDGRRLAVLGDEAVTLLTLEGERTLSIPLPPTRESMPVKDDSAAIAFAPTGRALATCREGEVTLWDSHTGERVLQLDTEAPATKFAFFPEGGRLAVGRNDGTVRFWKLEDGR